MDIKATGLKLWARVQRIVEYRFGRLLVLYALNFFTIAWQNIHMYQAQQLAVLGVDALFLLAGVTVFVILLGLVPGKRLQRLLFDAAVGISILLAALECFSIYNYQSLVGAGIVTALLQTNPHEAGEFLRMYVGVKGLVAVLLLIAAVAAGRRWLQEPRLTLSTRHRRSRALPIFLAAGLGAGVCLWQQYHSFVVND